MCSLGLSERSCVFVFGRMRKLVAEISRSLQKSPPISKLSLPDVVQHMLAPVQNLEKLNQSEIDICKGNVLIKYYQWRKEEAFRGYPTQEDIAKFYAEIENIGCNFSL
jgi:hypothetical protein